MPYICSKDRERFDQAAILGLKAQSVGDLNYILTMVCLGFLAKNKPNHYKDYNDVIGALECCRLELYRKKVIPYENQKIKENGDVY